MPRKEITTTIRRELALNSQSIVTSTTTVGNVIDTADYNGGVNFTASLGVRTDGVFTPLVEESDVSGSGYTAVDDIYLVKNDPASDVAPEAQVAAALIGSNTIAKIGYVGYKRYVRISIVSTVVTSGSTGVQVNAEKLGDVQAVPA